MNILSVSVMRTLFLFELDAAATRFHLTPKSDASRHYLFECSEDNDSGMYVYRESGVSTQFVSAALTPSADCSVYAALKGFSGKFYSAEQVRRASECKLFHERTGHQGRQTTLNSLDANGFSDNHLTSRDYLAMEDIWGPCANCVQGKMTARPARSPSRVSSPLSSVKSYTRTSCSSSFCSSRRTSRSIWPSSSWWHGPRAQPGQYRRAAGSQGCAAHAGTSQGSLPQSGAPSAHSS